VAQQARAGQQLIAKERPLPFSFFPVGRGTRRYGIFDVQFASSPWAVMQGAVNSSRIKAAYKAEARAFLEQGQDFYATATGRIAAHPLLFYYAFLNIGKALLRVRGYRGPLDYASHGLYERRAGDAVQPEDVEIVVGDRRAGRTDVFAELVETLGYGRPQPKDSYRVADLMAQVAVGHRLWRDATDEPERIVTVEDLEFIEDRKAREIWLRIQLDRAYLTRHGISHAELLRDGDLSPQFRIVESPDIPPDRLCLEQKEAIAYNHRATDEVMGLVELARPRLWRIVSAIPGGAYRRYYLCLTPPGDPRLPQVASLWALLFYLGSIVRYRPHLFDAVAKGPYGAFVDEYVASQPHQFLYLLASEMCRREIAKPAIV
jgi:hypothetical protein